MISKRFLIADVFTDVRFGGNQLAVFLDGSGLDSKTMQDIAREMNYSETTFLLPTEGNADYGIRIFTPAHELPFAGHPIVGSAYVIVSEKMKEWGNPYTAVTLEAGVGPLQIEVKTEGGKLGRSTMTQPLPVVRGTYSNIEAVANALSLEASLIRRTELPVETIFNGIAALIVPVASISAIQDIKIDSNALTEISNEVGASTVLVFTRETLFPTNTVHCRVFAPAAGVSEDAATGSANGCFGFYLVRHKVVQAAGTTKIISEQGYEMKRPSQLYIDVDVNLQNDEVTEVRVGGYVVIAGRGEIFVD